MSHVPMMDIQPFTKNSNRSFLIKLMGSLEGLNSLDMNSQ